MVDKAEYSHSKSKSCGIGLLTWIVTIFFTVNILPQIESGTLDNQSLASGERNVIRLVAGALLHPHYGILLPILYLAHQVGTSS